MLNDPAFAVQFIRPKRQKREGEDDTPHKRFIKTLPCCCCHRPAECAVMHPHHLLRLPYKDTRRGMGKTNDDRWTIPMCDICHEALHLHGDETEFLALRNVDGPALAAALWSVSGDYEEAVRIIG